MGRLDPLGSLLVATCFALAIGNVWLGIYRLRTTEPGLTGISSRPLRLLAWALSGADVRMDGSPRRLTLSSEAAGTLHILLGTAFLIIALVAVW